MSAGASPQHHGHLPSYVQHPSALVSTPTHTDSGVFDSANSSYSDIQDSGAEVKPPTKGKNGATGPAEGKAKPHVCPQCHRGFTTGGHLQRHQRIHTGVKAYKCPYPGCETRTSRQDNLQQQYVQAQVWSLKQVLISQLSYALVSDAEARIRLGRTSCC